MVALALPLALFAACDKAPTQPNASLALTSCPTVSSVNGPLTLTFTTPIERATATGANVVVTDAVTGLEIPGSLSVSGDGTQVAFAPIAPFRFSQRVRVRVQNIESEGLLAQIPVTVCEFVTPPPPITELYWRLLPHAPGVRLLGGSLVGQDSGFTMGQYGVIASRFGDQDFRVRFQQPQYSAGWDVDFVSKTQGFAILVEFRAARTPVLETRDAGVTFDTLATTSGVGPTRLLFRRTGSTPDSLFGVMGGGSTTTTSFSKFDPVARTFTHQIFSTGATGAVQDLDFPTADTTNGAAVTAGIRIPGLADIRGTLFTTSNGGASWSEVPSARADSVTQTYYGVARQSDGTIYVAGGSGYFARLTPDGAGGYTANRLLAGVVTNPDTTNPEALIYTDVQFAPDEPNVGWVVGAQLTGQAGGVPTYRGLIFGTTDGGQTWTRQGVQGAANYGAEFPRLNRIVIGSSTNVWLIGDAGTVLKLEP